MRRHWKPVAAAILTLALVGATPAAWSATAKPAQITLVTFTASSLTSTGATLSFSWPAVAGATKYEIFAGTSYDAIPTIPVGSTTATSYTLTGLEKGVDYFVQVRGTNSAGNAPRSPRVGHGTITTESTATSDPTLNLLTWNICSNACSGITSRKKTIDSRIGELAPDIVGLEEASKYNVAPSGYAFGFDGQNDILYRTSKFSAVKNSAGTVAKGSKTFASKYATAGHGVRWAALRNKSTGKYIIIFDVHLLAGTSATATQQREYEATQINPYVQSTVATLKKSFGTLTAWASAPAVIMGDFNTNKSRVGDDTQTTLEKAGWYDAYDQAHALSGQHFNSANPSWQTTPVIGVKWGDHVDKVLVQPSRAIVKSWANAGKMSGGKFVAPLGSDHHPVQVKVALH